MKTPYISNEQYSAFGKIKINFLAVIRVLLGSVFIFSGFVKAIDPLGSTYKFEDYFHAFGGIFESFSVIAFPLAILLSTIELVIGLSLILKVHVRITNFIALLFMLVMTPLTLYIALKKNLVSDCGCFGDALVISNWATFYKNLVLLAMVIVLLFFQHYIRPFLTKLAQNFVLMFFVFGAVGISFYCYRHLPFIDFRPYKIGTNISEAMIIPEDAQLDKYETTFIYEKNGSQKEFTLENYPKGDTTWKFVDQKSILISEGYKPPIHDFSIVNSQYDDITESVLYDRGKTYLLVMYDLEKTSELGALKAENLYQESLVNGTKFYALTASMDDVVQQFKEKTKVTYPFCKTDPITLKTIIRANPGLVLIENGNVKGKWNWRDF